MENNHFHPMDTIVRLLGEAQSGQSRFPPTELYEEGWMLRLLLDAGMHGHGGLPFAPAVGATWYSEARLASAFAPRVRGDAFGEGETHADAVVGHFSMRDLTEAGLEVAPDATQLVVIEAKMGSKLAAGTTRARWFDQAARSVAALANVIHQAGVPVGQVDSLGFLVVAPQARIDTEPTFTQYMDRTGIVDKVQRRIDLYRDDAVRHTALQSFYEATFLPLMDRATIATWSWEQLIDTLAPERQHGIRDFYEHCLRFNRVAS